MKHSARAFWVAAGLIFLGAGCASGPYGGVGPAADPNIAGRLETTVKALSGERNVYRPAELHQAASFITSAFEANGYQPERQWINIDATFFKAATNQTHNIEVVLSGTRDTKQTLVIGAHYDTRVAMSSFRAKWPPRPEWVGTPGANDNASGVAALLEVAHFLKRHPPGKTVRLVAFSNEEPPFWQRRDSTMGSHAYAARLKEQGVHVQAMVSLETMGCYTNRPQTKRPFLASLVGLPKRPDYVSFVSNLNSRATAAEWAKLFGQHSPVPAYVLGLPAFSDMVGWSDDWAFWQFGYPAFCVTDTAYLRSDDYHELSDVPQHLSYPEFAQVVDALCKTIAKMAE